MSPIYVYTIPTIHLSIISWCSINDEIPSWLEETMYDSIEECPQGQHIVGDFLFLPQSAHEMIHWFTQKVRIELPYAYAFGNSAYAFDNSAYAFEHIYPEVLFFYLQECYKRNQILSILYLHLLQPHDRPMYIQFTPSQEDRLLDHVLQEWNDNDHMENPDQILERILEQWTHHEEEDDDSDSGSEIEVVIK